MYYSVFYTIQYTKLLHSSNFTCMRQRPALLQYPALMHSRAYGAPLHLGPTTLNPLQLMAASSEWPDGARHPLSAAAYERRAQREPASVSGAR